MPIPPGEGRSGAPKNISVTRFAASVREFACARAALLVLAVFLVVGVFIIGDYGVTYDDPYQRSLGEHMIDYVMGGR